MSDLNLTRIMLRTCLQEASKKDPANDLACLARLETLYNEVSALYEEMGSAFKPNLYIPVQVAIKEQSADKWLDLATDYWEKIGPLQVERRNRKGAEHGKATLLNVQGLILHRRDSFGITRWWSHEFHQHFASVKEFRQFLKEKAKTLTVW